MEISNYLETTPPSELPTRSDRLPGLDASLAERLNQECFCLSLDDAALTRALDADSGLPGLAELVRTRCPSAFAARPVFIGSAQEQRIGDVVAAIESVVALPAYRAAAFARAPTIVRATTTARAPTAVRAPAIAPAPTTAAPTTARPALPEASEPHGVFLGYDFHVNRDELGLIEINTNAGGAMLNATLARAQSACCAAVAPWLPSLAAVARFEREIIGMFECEWSLAGRTRALRTVAIVDDDPEHQYLYPEFLLFARLFERHGLKVVIADPRALRLQDGKLWFGDTAIDLVYNRLCDFYLEAPASQALAQAWLADAVVLTPHPRAHALYADKRNLAVLSDDRMLSDFGVAAATRRLLLAHVPRTEVLTPANAEALWSQRRRLFFKPVAGYGSRAAYRGDKLTRRVWDEIRSADYVAQALVTPGERRIEEGPAAAPMKFDLRAYAYGEQVQWLAARLYRGQTTNFRTIGGGFAPVCSSIAGEPATPAAQD